MVSANDLLATPVVNVLGWVLLHFVWQGLAVAFTLWLLFFVFRTSQVRYVLACAALVVMALLPVFTGLRVASEQVRQGSNRYVLEALAKSTAENVLNKTNEPIEGVQAVSEYGYENPTARANSSTNYLRVTIALDRYLPWLVVLWFVGVVTLSIRLLGSLLVTQRLRTRLTKAVPKEIEERLENLASQLKLKSVSVVESLSVQVPMVIGWLRPIILLPTSALSGLSVGQLEMILAHELAHIRRHDYLVNLLQTVIETLFFYHPAVWWVSRNIRETREHCCDDLAIALCGGNKYHYARALASLDSLRPNSNLAVSNIAAAANGGSLLKRIERLAGRNPQTGGIMNWLVSLMLVVIPWLVLSSSYAQAKLPMEIEQNIDAFVQSRLEASGVPGIQVAVVQDGEVTFNKAYGLADVETNAAMSTTTHIPLGAEGGFFFLHIALKQLFEKGLLKPEDTVSQHLPWLHFQEGEETSITVQNLIDGNANIRDDVKVEGMTPEPTIETTVLDPSIKTTEDYFRSLSPDELVTAPTRQSTFILNDSLLILMIEKVSGMSFEEYTKQNIFAPLGMNATFDLENAKKLGLATLYNSKRNTNTDTNKTDWIVEPATFEPPAALNSALGFSMSSQDASKFLVALLSRDTKILSKKSWQELAPTQAELGSTEPSIFGIVANMSVAGFIMEFRPDSNLGYVVATNYNSPFTMEHPLYQVLESVNASLSILNDQVPSSRNSGVIVDKDNPNPTAKTIANVSGTYLSALGPVELFAEGNELHGKMLDREFRLEGRFHFFRIRSDDAMINGLVIEADNKRILLDGRQFAFRVE